MSYSHRKVHLLSWEVDVLLGLPGPLVVLRVFLRIAWTFLSLAHTKGTLIGCKRYGNHWASRRVFLGFINSSARRLLILDMSASGGREEDSWYRAYRSLTYDPLGSLDALEDLSKSYGTNLREAFRYEVAQQFGSATVPPIGWADRSLARQNRLQVHLSREAERLLFARHKDEAPDALRVFLRDLVQRHHGACVERTPSINGWDLLWGWVDYDKLVAHVGVGTTRPSLYLESCVPAGGLAEVLVRAQQVTAKSA